MVVVFLDLRKAFDTVKHDVLISKLYNFIISVKLDAVRIKGAHSSFVRNTMGVPQGSVRSSFFNLYINDLPQHCQGVNLQLFADDTVLNTHAKNTQRAAEKLTHAMQGVADCLEKSCLTLNISKTKGMFFCKTKGQILTADIFTKN